MAKKQTFAEKVKKGTGGTGEKMIKLVLSYQSPETGVWRFGEKIIKIPADANEKTILDEQIKINTALLRSRA